MKQTLLTLLSGDRIISVLAAFLVLAVLSVTFLARTDAAAPVTGSYYVVSDTPQLPEGIGRSVTFKPESKYVVAIADPNNNDTLVVIDTETFEVVRTIEPEAGSLNTARFSADGNWLAVGGDETFVYDTSATDPADWSVGHQANETGDVTALAFSEDGAYLAIGYDNQVERVQILDVDADWAPVTLNGGQPFDLGLGSGRLTSLDFSPNGAYLVVGGESTYTGEYTENINIIATSGWTEVDGLPQLDAFAAYSVAFTPDGNHLIAGTDYEGDGGSLYVYDTSAPDAASWTLQRRFNPNNVFGAWGLAFSPDGNTLAIAYDGSPFFGLVDISSEDPADWVAIDTESVGSLGGGKAGSQGQGAAYSSDGTLIAIATDGGTGLSFIRTLEPAAETEPEPEPEPEESSVSTRSHRSGGSVQSRVKALTENGNTAAANTLIAQFPNLFDNASVETLMARVAQLQAQLQAQLAALTGASTSSPVAIGLRDLQLNDMGEDVLRLQQILIDANVGPAAAALKANGTSTFFGPLTQAALAEYQAKYGITPSVGYFGIKTRTEMTAAGRTGLWW